MERAVLAMIRAKELGKEITWEDLLSTDINERLFEQ